MDIKSNVISDKLELNHIKIDLNGKRLIDINASVTSGDVLTIMGPSGSGKSTLLAYIGGFLDKAFTASGTVAYGDLCLTDLPPHERRAGILFQDPLLFPHLSVLGNLLLSIPPSEKGKAHRKQLALSALGNSGLGDFADRDPDTLSGGQKARIALQRVLLSKPRFLLLDEPFSKLDMQLRDQTRRLVFDMAKQAGLPIILVTHDQADADAADGHIHHVLNN